MGGFEGGDEAGFWEEAVPSRYINKQNQNTKEKSHIQKSDLGFSVDVQDGASFSTLCIEPSGCDSFTIEGCETPLRSNIIYKTCQALIEFTDDMDIVEFFSSNKVVLKACDIPTPAHAAAFLYMAKELCSLVLLPEELEEIASLVDTEIGVYLEKYL